MTNKDAREDALKFLADEGQKCDGVDALRELLVKVGVSVKPLEWVDVQSYCSVADAPLFGRFRVETYGDKWTCVFSVPGYSDTFTKGHFGTRSEAKATAQADYERRIISALIAERDG